MVDRWILVVDDEDDFRSIMDELLREEGFGVKQAKDTASALSILDANRATPPSLILLDMWMPGGCGLKFLDRLNELYPDISANLPIILCTAATKEIPAEFAGANRDVLAKPAGIDEILRKVHALVDRQDIRPAS